jgi:hypothetical protein
LPDRGIPLSFGGDYARGSVPASHVHGDLPISIGSSTSGLNLASAGLGGG